MHGASLAGATVSKRDQIRLWRDGSIPGGLELLRASCFDYRYPAHFHEEFVIAVFVRGAQRHRVSRYQGVAEAGTFMIIQPGEVHTGEAVERDRGWDYCALYPTATFLEHIADDVLGGRGGIDFGCEILRRDPVITRSFLRAHAVIGNAPDVLEKQCAAYEIFGTLLARYGKRTGNGSRPTSPSADVRNAVAFLDAHYHRQVMVSEVASAVGLSEFHFMRTFRAKTGLSVHRYLTQIRLRRAKALLVQGVSAAETALSVGFFDQSHLINQFRAHFGVTPAAFVLASR
jgi:AraC-like DNA-binding protein